MPPFVVRFQDDQTFEQARDVLTGLEFVATLQIRTPLAILEHHGEFHPGPPSAAPKYSSIAEGFWSYRTKSWSELAGRPLEVPKDPESIQASDIGPITASEYLPFLKDFRRIVEAENSVNARLVQILELRNKTRDFEQIWSRLENSYSDFPQSFFYMKLTAICGIGPTLARRLFQHGFVDLYSLQAASDLELERIPGLGSKLMKGIRDFQSSARGVGRDSMQYLI